MRRWVAQTVWAALYLITMLMPVALSWAVPGDDAMDRAAVESGLLAASALACAVVLPSRLRSLTSSFGIEDVLGSHRWLGGFVAVAVAAHLAVVLVSDPASSNRGTGGVTSSISSPANSSGCG
jgi:predicted ferric reductase